MRRGRRQILERAWNGTSGMPAFKDHSDVRRSIIEMSLWEGIFNMFNLLFKLEAEFDYMWCKVYKRTQIKDFKLSLTKYLLNKII